MTVFFGFGQGVGGGEWEGDMLFAGAAADSGDRLSGNRFLGVVAGGKVSLGGVGGAFIGNGDWSNQEDAGHKATQHKHARLEATHGENFLSP